MLSNGDLGQQALASQCAHLGGGRAASATWLQQGPSWASVHSKAERLWKVLDWEPGLFSLVESHRRIKGKGVMV